MNDWDADEKPAVERMAEKASEYFERINKEAEAPIPSLPMFVGPQRPTVWDIINVLGLSGGATVGFLLGWLARSLLR